MDSAHFSPYRPDGKLVRWNRQWQERPILIYRAVWLCLRCYRSSTACWTSHYTWVSWYVVYYLLKSLPAHKVYTLGHWNLLTSTSSWCSMHIWCVDVSFWYITIILPIQQAEIEFNLTSTSMRQRNRLRNQVQGAHRDHCKGIPKHESYRISFQCCQGGRNSWTNWWRSQFLRKTWCLGLFIWTSWSAFPRSHNTSRPAKMLRGQQHGTILCSQVCTTCDGETHGEASIPKCCSQGPEIW